MKQEIAEFYEFETKLAGFEDLYNGMVYDLDDETQNKQARSDKREIGSVIARLDERHKEIKAPLKEKIDVIDGARKQIKDRLLGVRDRIGDQIKAHEEKKKAHEEKLESMVEAIRALSVFQTDEPEPGEIAERLQAARAIEVGPEYEHKAHEADQLRAWVIEKLTASHENARRREEERAELARLKSAAEERERADREAAIRKEAEEKARKDAEEAAQAEIAERDRRAQEKIAAAERQAQEAAQAAKRAAQEERERIEAERAALDAEAARQAEQEAARKAQAEHRASIHTAAKSSLMAQGFDEHTATRIVTLIKESKIAHIQVVY